MVGNALKVLSLRIRGASTELQEMGEDTDGVAISTSKLRSEMKALTGVDIMIDDNTFKSTYDILLEISKVWDNLSDISQADTLEKIAGKTRASTVAGLLKNMQVAEEAVFSAQNSAGSALKENETYLDGIEGRLKRFNAQLEELWLNTIDSDLVKTFVDMGTSILGVVDKVGLLETALISIATISTFKGKGKRIYAQIA